MSVMGQKQTFTVASPMSGVGVKADIAHTLQRPIVLAVEPSCQSGVLPSVNTSMSHEDRKIGIAENVISNAPGQ